MFYLVILECQKKMVTQLPGIRVLVVDEEADTRQFIRTVLEEC
jgi:hypoxanthine phosphoribosyltransferase